MGGTTEQGSGWVPVEAIEDTRDAASREAADHLLGLAPRERVLALMNLAAAGSDGDKPLRPADLIGVLATFDGAAQPTAEELCRRFPGAVAARP
jgi:hypothetical protein